MRTKLTVALLVAVLGFYAVLIGAKGVALIFEDSVVAVVLGIGILLVPVIGVLLVWREIQFGSRSARLAAVLDAEGGLPVDDLPRRPSGRVERQAADAVFAERQAQVEADPENWRTWYRLGLAYDDAGDRTRARSAIRQAIALFG